MQKDYVTDEDESDMQETLRRCREVAIAAGPGVYHYCWSATAYTASHRFIRGDKLMLNVVQLDESSGDVTIHRRAPVLHRERERHCLTYSPKTTCRIVSGPRKGFVVESDDVSTEERVQLTGLSKSLSIGDAAWNISLRRRGDVEIVDLLEGMLEAPAEDEEIRPPRLYITIPSSSQRLPFLRERVSAIDWIQRQPGYDHGLDLVRNLYSLRESIVLDAGSDREAWPYRYFQGSGVVAASPHNIADWYRTSADELHLPHVSVSL